MSLCSCAQSVSWIDADCDDLFRLYGRQLEKWEPEGADSGLGLEEESAHETGKWDQFKANEELFGVRTSFNMEIYTAKLDASKSRFSYAEADKLAKEISKDPTIRRVLPDGQQSTIDDSGVSTYFISFPEPYDQHQRRIQLTNLG